MTRRRPAAASVRLAVRAFRATPIAAAVGTLLLGAGSARAQEPKTEPELAAIPAVTVIGIRAAIESSIAIKREATSIIEVIVAEDIGKLPGLSIAESLARVPGVAAQRVDGRAQVISIRGMAPRYGATLLNGREMVSTGDNRSVEYDQFPAELINKVAIFKTPDATLIGQGLSGTVNMAAIRPLDLTARTVSLNGRYERNDNGALNADTSASGNRLSVSYVDQFANRTFGVALGYARLDAPGQEKHYKSWWWANTANWGAPLPGTPAGSIALQGFEAGVASTERIRDGLMGVLEWRPSKNLRSTLDLYYSKFEQTEHRRLYMSDIHVWSGASYTGATTSLVDGNTIVTGGTIAGNRPVVLNVLNQRQDDVQAAGWNTQFKAGDWTHTVDLSWSRADRQEQNAELQAGTAAANVTFSNAVIATGAGVSQFTPSVNLADPAAVMLRDPGGWGRDGRSQFPNVEDAMKSLRLSTKRDLAGMFSAAETGVNISERTKKMSRTEVYYMLRNGRAPVAVAPDLLLAPSTMCHSGNCNGVLSFDFNGALARYYDTQPAALSEGPGRRWDVTEDVTTAYLKLDIDIDGKVPVRGNLGLQAVHQRQRSNGLAWNPTPVGGGPGQAVPMSGGASYVDYLPSLNLAAELTKDLVLRFGLARVMARPNMEDMRAGFSDISVRGGGAQGDVPPITWRANGGNPGLEPWRANAVDFSLEKYVDRRTYGALAYFHKDVRNFVYQQTIPFDFTGFPNPTLGTAAPRIPSSNIGTLTTQANGDKGRIEGWELSGNLDAATFWPALAGFGVSLSYSRTSSSLHEGDDVTRPLDGLSGRVRNLAVYFERQGLQARVAQRHRSKFETTVRGTFGENVPSAISAESIIDLQLGYTWAAGALRGLGVLFQVNNANDEPYRTRVGIATGSVDPKATLPERYTTYGRQYLLGLTYTF